MKNFFIENIEREFRIMRQRPSRRNSFCGTLFSQERRYIFREKEINRPPSLRGANFDVKLTAMFENSRADPDLMYVMRYITDTL